jgi:hypothetical protein
MLAAQGGLCAICQVAPAAQVDHDHVTGAVRALLCFNCNGGLGQFKDDAAVLRAAADYVERHGGSERPSSRPPTPARGRRRPATWRQFGMCRHGFSALRPPLSRC